MRYQVWLAPDARYAVYSEELTEREAQAFQTIGYELDHSFEAASRENAEAYFVAWCDNAGVDS